MVVLENFQSTGLAKALTRRCSILCSATSRGLKRPCRADVWVVLQQRWDSVKHAAMVARGVVRAQTQNTAPHSQALPPAMVLVRSPLLQGGMLQVLQRFFAAMAAAGIPQVGTGVTHGSEVSHAAGGRRVPHPWHVR